MQRTGRGVHEKPGRPPTPECSECSRKLVKASVTEWKCVNSDCSMKDQKVSTGVFPT